MKLFFLNSKLIWNFSNSKLKNIPAVARYQQNMTNTARILKFAA
jgi:hypothetical protein